MPGWRTAWWLVIVLAGCSAAARRQGASDGDFFPLVPRSEWEYEVVRRGGRERFRFMATVKPDPFVVGDGRSCPVVDEVYADQSASPPLPIVYCSEGGYLHRMMSLEYRGAVLQDNGLRAGELKFLPSDLAHAAQWEGRTSAYRLPDGSGFEVWQAHKAVPTRQDVNVPAGNFAACIRVDTTATHGATGADGSAVGPQVVYYYSDWYAPGVGLVKTEQRNAAAEILATIELVRYHVAPVTADRAIP